MTDDQIIQLLKEIDMCTHTYDNGMHIITTYDITKMRRFAERISAVEREACAKVCEEKQTYSMPIPCPDGIEGCCVAHVVPARREKTGSECAAAIRARGEQEKPR